MKKILIVFALALLLTGCVADVEYELEAGVDTIDVFDEHELKGCNVYIDMVEYALDVVDNPINNEIVGEYIVSYGKEIDGETYQCQRVVFVVDRTAPSLTLLPGIDTIEVGHIWNDAGVEVVDNYDQDVMIVVDYTDLGISETGEIITQEGVYNVSYTATDDFGNESTVERVIHVITED